MPSLFNQVRWGDARHEICFRIPCYRPDVFIVLRGLLRGISSLNQVADECENRNQDNKHGCDDDRKNPLRRGFPPQRLLPVLSCDWFSGAGTNWLGLSGEIDFKRAVAYVLILSEIGNWLGFFACVPIQTRGRSHSPGNILELPGVN